MDINYRETTVYSFSQKEDITEPAIEWSRAANRGSVEKRVLNGFIYSVYTSTVIDNMLLLIRLLFETILDSGT